MTRIYGVTFSAVPHGMDNPIRFDVDEDGSITGPSQYRVMDTRRDAYGAVLSAVVRSVPTTKMLARVNEILAREAEDVVEAPEEVAEKALDPEANGESIHHE